MYQSRDLSAAHKGVHSGYIYPKLMILCHKGDVPTHQLE